jgi:hypothetical protein
MKAAVMNTAIVLIALAGATIAVLTFPKLNDDTPVVSANEALATKCVAVGDGRVLKTVFLGSNPYFGRGMSSYTPAQLFVDEKTGDRRIVGTIYTIDGRKIERFNARDIKIVDCPA